LVTQVVAGTDDEYETILAADERDFNGARLSPKARMLLRLSVLLSEAHEEGALPGHSSRAARDAGAPHRGGNASAETGW
jgi:hypothetical protein